MVSDPETDRQIKNIFRLTRMLLLDSFVMGRMLADQLGYEFMDGVDQQASGVEWLADWKPCEGGQV